MSEPACNEGSAPPVVIAVVRDLMFVGRIVAEARAAAVSLTVVRDAAGLAGAPQAALLIADLNLPGSIEAAAGWRKANPGKPVVGFVAHTDAATIATARAAGINDVLARSAFVARLPALLGSLRLPI